MSNNQLSVKTREGAGRGKARRLRAQGMIPAVIYGKSGSTSLSVMESDFRMLMRKIHGGAAVITLANETSGSSTMSVIQATQRNPLTDRFEHIDFLEVSAGQAITAHLPIHAHGEPVGVKTGQGILETVLHEVEISCLPGDLPESIEVDVSALEVGDTITVAGLPELKGVTYRNESDAVIFSVVEARIQEEPAEVEEVDPASVEATAQKSEESDEKEES